MAQTRHRFSILRFSALVALQIGALLVAIRLLLPGLWARQLAAGPLAIVLVFLGMHLLLAFFEWFFHRYVLHSIMMGWLTEFAHAHRRHHGVTSIRLRPAASGAGRVVLNEYPITREEQFPDSAFPAYALAGFWAFFTPLIVALQLLWPNLPFVFGGYLAIAWSMSLYEILHAVEHWPYEWWKKATESRRFGAFWRRLYGFHLMHHANVRCNEAISGFFGLPVPDWCFGTLHQPKALLLEGREATARDFAIRPPRSIVRWVDRWALRREASAVRAPGR